ncbi:hypothetical protein FRC03_008499 [Tulasnella sp. 419]|nr:hypothetical protein FRC03_008499 [Tulasnella sp. 419]
MAGILINRLVPTILWTYLLQLTFASIFVPLQTEKLYDFCGSLGFLSAAFISVYYPYLRDRFWLGVADAEFFSPKSLAPRQLLLNISLVLWAIRLGSFLLIRILKNGRDSRFDKIKIYPRKFLYYWVAQATWVALVGLPVWISNALPASAHPSLGNRDYFGLVLFIFSFLLEALADYQKSNWRRDRDSKKHDKRFISIGLWSISRHPNYAAEVGIWTGIWFMASSTTSSPLLPPGLLLGTMISPLFTYFLLTRLSGVPPLERANDKNFGSDPRWKLYKQYTPIFFPWGPAGDFKG